METFSHDLVAKKRVIHRSVPCRRRMVLQQREAPERGVTERGPIVTEGFCSS